MLSISSYWIFFNRMISWKWRRTMRKIDHIWEELIGDSSLKQGFLLRRFSSSVLPDVFVALQQPERSLCIASVISESIDVNLSQFENLNEIQILLVSDLNQRGKRLLIFKLVNSKHRDIFSVLCEDLITCISNETNESRLVKTFLNRFEK